ncbi:hypothetical protein HDU67_002454 [Dinochytrium kinnereticum]|nr:hypothetical protein HDU67_002454 [Dinochytrium kinnereticum]
MYLFWPIILISSMVDKVLPRYFAMRKALFDLAAVSPSPLDIVDENNGVLSTEPKEGGLPIRETIKRNRSEDANIMKEADEKETKGFGTVSLFQCENEDTIEVAESNEGNYTTKRSQRYTTRLKKGTIANAVVETMIEVGELADPLLPFDIVRRDQCISDLIASIISLGLMIVAPAEFLALPVDNDRVSEVFYNDAARGSLLTTADGRQVIGVKGLTAALGGRQWAAIVIVTVVSIAYSEVLEMCIVEWERTKGFPMYRVKFELPWKLILSAAIGISIPILWMLAGAHGLFSFGPISF